MRPMLRLRTAPVDPRLAILALTAGCLAVFAATIPLPRADGQLAGSDGVGYFVYLPSVFLDGDLDFSDEYAYFYGYDPVAARHAIDDRGPTGLPVNRFGVGPAILWAPFFLAAHLLAVALQALGASVATDGYGALYQAPVLAGSIVYGGLGSWYCFRAAARLATPSAALAATFLVVLAGNLIYYLTVEPSMSHALSMFVSSVFFHLWTSSRGRSSWSQRLQLGGLGGMMALIRPQDGLFLALPIADEILAARRDRAGGSRTGWPGRTLPLVGAAVLVFVPQLVAWKLLYGSFFRSGYAHELDRLFYWSSPRLLDVLFSAERGLFVWHPIFLAGLLGLGLIWRRDRRLAGLALLGFVLQWYLVSSWHEWVQGDAFGGRMFIVCAPIFVFGTAALADEAARRASWRAVTAAGLVLVLLNFLLLVQYRLELMWSARPLTFSDLTLGRFLHLL